MMLAELAVERCRRSPRPPSVFYLPFQPLPKPAPRRGLGLWLRLVCGIALGIFLASGSPRGPLELSQADFEAKVLGAKTPVLVMFNLEPQCGCAEDELRVLSGEWAGQVAVYTMNAKDSPELAAGFGVGKDALVLLFRDGRLVKSADAIEIERAIKAKHGGHFDGPAMKRELERFVQTA